MYQPQNSWTGDNFIIRLVVQPIWCWSYNFLVLWCWSDMVQECCYTGSRCWSYMTLDIGPVLGVLVVCHYGWSHKVLGVVGHI